MRGSDFFFFGGGGEMRGVNFSSPIQRVHVSSNNFEVNGNNIPCLQVEEMVAFLGSLVMISIHAFLSKRRRSFCCCIMY